MSSVSTEDRHASSVFGPRTGRVLSALIVHSPDSARVGHVLSLDAPVSIGREQQGDVNLVLDDPRLSRQHAVLLREGSVVIQDQQSKNGTFVDGERVEQATISAGAVVRIGDTILVVDEFSAGQPYRSPDPRFVGCSPAFLRLVSEIDRLAPTIAPVLIMGETGTGKELVARRVHERSGRRGPFVPINCGAIPAGLAESTLFGHRRGAFTGAVDDSQGSFPAADGGTLFLDEVGELPIDLQPKLLRVLETSEVAPVGGRKTRKLDVRIVAATNSDLDAEVVAGAFRADLFARLRGFVVEPPPLRRRRCDIPLLMRHFLAELRPGAPLRCTANFLSGLLLHPWRHNVRELKMAAQRLAVHLGDDGLCNTELLGVLTHNRSAPARQLTAEEPKEGVSPPPRPELVAAIERFGGNVARVAKHFGKHRKQIYRWCERDAIDLTAYRR